MEQEIEFVTNETVNASIAVAISDILDVKGIYDNGKNFEEEVMKWIMPIINKHYIKRTLIGWKGYVVVDPKTDNYKYSPIFMEKREANLWLANNGDDGLEVIEVDILPVK